MARTDENLRGLLSDLESDHVERKASLSGRETKDRIGQAVCAFSNDLADYRTSGVVFIGVDDDGRVSGLPITDELLTELANLRDQGTQLPPPIMRVHKLTTAEGDVAVVEVEPSPSPPTRFKGQVWIRVGPRRAIASAEEERRLVEKRRSADLPYDAQPIRGAQTDDLDGDLFEREYLPSVLAPEVLEANHRSQLQRLSSLRLATPDGTPTVGGMLVAGVDPTRFLPGAYIQFVRVDGTALDAPIIDEKRLNSALPTLLRGLDELLRLNIRTAVTIGDDVTDTRQSDYPLAALQQLTRNAIMHRNYEGTATPVRITWYSDRVEIYSPGGPYGTVTVENFGSPGLTDYRNPTLAEAMSGLGYVQKFGAGIQIAKRSLENNGNPPVEFTPDPSYVGVVVREAA